MPQIVRNIDEIAREKKRDVLYLEFHPLDVQEASGLPRFLNYRYEEDAMRSKVLAWLTENGIGWEACGGYASENSLSAYRGQVHVNVPFDENNPVYRLLRDYLEFPDGAMRHEGVQFYALSLELAMKNAHHDEPGFWDRWAENF